MKRVSFILAFFFFSLKAQESLTNLSPILQADPIRYEKDHLSADFHAKNREQLKEMLPDDGAAIFFASLERNRSNDVYYEYHQDPNFYYLTGVIEPNSMLILFKEKQQLDGELVDEILFIQKKNEANEIWNGRRMGKKWAKDSLKVQMVMNNTELVDFDWPKKQKGKVLMELPFAMEKSNEISTESLSGMVAEIQEITKNKSAEPEKKSTFFQLSTIGAIMAELRQSKQDEELVLMKKAIDITCQAQIKLMQEINGNMTEYQTEAIIEYEFKKNGAEYPGFPSIQGNGENSCVLHYTSNRKPFNGKRLLVSDVGAEYHGYTADVTRTIPVNGKFNEEERLIYQLVFQAQAAGIEEARVGNSFWAPHQAALKIIAKGLVNLGIIEKEQDVKRYFMHGSSHYLGLDVHDPGLYSNLQINEVITVEPGIYIKAGSACDPKWWNIGVRIEDDILISEKGPINLSDSAPRSIEEIEAIMGGEKEE